MDGQDIPRNLGVFLDLVPEMRNIDMHVVHASLVLCAPHVRKDVVERQDLARVACKIHQETEFNGRELQRLSISMLRCPLLNS